MLGVDEFAVVNQDHDPKPRWLVVSSHHDHYQLWRDTHRENHMQWEELKGLKERLVRVDEQMADRKSVV